MVLWDKVLITYSNDNYLGDVKHPNSDFLSFSIQAEVKPANTVISSIPAILPQTNPW
jgi:hypothetical protein